MDREQEVMACHLRADIPALLKAPHPRQAVTAVHPRQAVTAGDRRLAMTQVTTRRFGQLWRHSLSSECTQNRNVRLR